MKAPLVPLAITAGPPPFLSPPFRRPAMLLHLAPRRQLADWWLATWRETEASKRKRFENPRDDAKRSVVESSRFTRFFWGGEEDEMMMGGLLNFVENRWWFVCLFFFGGVEKLWTSKKHGFYVGTKMFFCKYRGQIQIGSHVFLSCKTNDSVLIHQVGCVLLRWPF